ncbi:MAG: trigger factor [Oculatellaceae cyanobacterium Prado106]|jgi:trigger factor|nr:trigger factor [Oculatellaceae cyanobacterium Prado106]
MKVTQEKLPASQIGLEIEISPEMSSKAYEKTLQEFTRSANIPGFRKGKVPRQVLIQRYGSTRIKATVLEELIQESLKEAVDQEKLQTLGQFSLVSDFEDLLGQFEPGTPITFKAAVDVPPEAELKQYKGLEVKAEEIKYDPSQVDKVIEDYRKRAATLVPVEGRGAEATDVAIVDFAGKIVGAPEGEEDIPGGSAEDFQIDLSQGGFIPGFIEGIIGMTPGETKEVSATFPDDYPQEDLGGKDAVFTITVKELKEQELPELDDDFAQEVSQFETLAELRESLETRYQKEAEEKTKENKQEALLDELIKYVEVEIPETMIKQEVDFSINQTAMRFQQQGMDVRKIFTNELVSVLREQAKPEAMTRIKRTLALGEVAKLESLTVEASAVEARVSELLEEFGGDRDIDINRVREFVTEDLLKDNILDWLEANGTVELVPEGSLKPAEPEVPEAPEAPASEATVDVAVEAEPATEEPEVVVDAAPDEAAPEPKATEAKAKSKAKADKADAKKAEDEESAEAAPKKAKADKPAKSTKQASKTESK